MKKKITRHMMAIAVLSVILSILLVVAVFYKLFQNQVIADLRTDAYLLQAGGIPLENTLKAGGFSQMTQDVRITLIGAGGEVLYDNSADSGNMDNHKERPEIREALEKGEGLSIRQSDTMGRNTYYYALLLENGEVLRISKQSHSIWSIYGSALPVVLLAFAGMVLLSLLLSHFLTRSIVAPIEEMGNHLDHLEEVSTYEELRPFVKTIQEQHDAIIKNANMRQDFTANVTHELKTPLAAISGYSELIENGMAESGDITRFAASIHKNAIRLLSLINDIIRLSELDTAKELETEELDLYELAEISVDMLQVSAAGRNVTLSLEGQSCKMKANRQMMEELLYNLCDNAIRYNNKGGHVYVRAQYENGRPVLEVRDTGIGISKQHQARIFERFYRVDKSRSKSTGGTGLGLAIVKHIVAVHNAELKMESEEGRGTKIRVVF